jgi:tetratricopeptide (TPR) repeat protein
VITEGSGSLPGGELERAFSLLRRGDVVGAWTALTRAPGANGSDDLERALLTAEVRVCLGQGDLHEIDAVRQRIVDAGGDRTSLLRVEAARADYYVHRCDPRCGAVAAAALPLVDEHPLSLVEPLWARGRIYRALAVANSLQLQGELEPSATRLQRAFDDLDRAGFHAEAVLSVAMARTVWASDLRDDYDEARDVVVTCLDQLRTAGSMYVDIALALRVLLDQMIGDVGSMHTGIAELSQIASARPLHPFGEAVRFHTHTIARLVREGPTPELVLTLDSHVALLLDDELPFASALLVSFAGVITDDGYLGPEHLALARRWATQAALAPVAMLRTDRDRASVLTRIDLLERRDEAAVAAIDADLGLARRLGLRRDVGRRAVRAALAARRIGRDDLADRFLQEALDELPPADERTLWENSYVALAVTTRAAESVEPPRLRLLDAEVSIEDQSGRRTLSTALARLVVALVADGGTASVDRLVDVLWPDADLDVGRSRLRVVLHRLRRTMDDGQGGDAVVRRGNLVVLSPNVAVDVTGFERLATSDDPDDRRAALEIYQSEVAGMQLAYDDVAAPLRRRLVAVWRALVAEALDDPRLPADTVNHVLAVARRGADADTALADICRRAEERLRLPVKRG